MTEPEYRQDDRTIGYCPQCGQRCSTVGLGGSGFCPDHGRVFVDWNPQRKEPNDDPRIGSSRSTA